MMVRGFRVQDFQSFLYRVPAFMAQVTGFRARDFRSFLYKVPTYMAQVPGCRGAGPKKVGGPAPQIGLVRKIVAQVPA